MGTFSVSISPVQHPDPSAALAALTPTVEPPTSAPKGGA